MKRLNYLIPATFLAFVAVPFAVEGFQSSRSDATYHQTGASKMSAPARLPEQVPNQAIYPRTKLTKIEILPSSIELAGPRYSQRLVVEGTFADGHQEDVTSEAQIV